MFILRPPKDSDLIVLGTWRNDPEIRRSLMWKAPLPEPSAIRAWIRRRSEDPGGAFFVVDEDGAPIGFVQLTNVNMDDRTAFLGILIAAEARGRGAASIALDALENEARALGIERLLLDSLLENQRAISFYLKKGYRRIAILSGHFEGADVERMEKNLR